MIRALAAPLLALAALAAPALAGPFDLPEEPAESALRTSGLIDMRAAWTSPERSWLLGGTNKLRLGGKNTVNVGGNLSQPAFAVTQASLILDAAVPQGPDLHVQLDADAGFDDGNADVGLFEAYAAGAPQVSGHPVRLRAGAFVPPISWEHVEPGWTTRETLTPSVIGSWIAEEVRAYGAEASWEAKGKPGTARFTGALFEGSDQAGRLLFMRGWALHDYQAKLNDSLNIPAGTPSRPFRELDGRAGFYARTELATNDGKARVGGGYWDNNADPNAIFTDKTGPAKAWSTQFWDAGGRVDAGRYGLQAQFMHGRSAAVGQNREAWEAWYVLASRQSGPWSVSGRYDHFAVFGGLESGYAVTADWQRDIGPRTRLSLEYIYLYASPSLAIRPSSERDQLLQLNYRVRFGA